MLLLRCELLAAVGARDGGDRFDTVALTDVKPDADASRVHLIVQVAHELGLHGMQQPWPDVVVAMVTARPSLIMLVLRSTLIKVHSPTNWPSPNNQHTNEFKGVV